MAASLETATRVERVVLELRKAVFQGKYPPGTPLRELTLARELDVSQATVREALQRLEHSGLVARKANLGSTVTRLSPKDVRERVELRAMLEVQAAEQAAARMGEAEFAELDRRLAALETAVERDRYYESAQADLEFHRYIWQCSGNDTLCRHLELLVIPLFAFISIVRSQGLERLMTTVASHRPLVDALRSRDRACIRVEFYKGATSAYGIFLSDSPERALASAFGYLQTEAL